MSWSEKVTRYKGEQEVRKQIEVQAEKQRALRGYKEYLQRWETSLSLLDKLGIKESLTQIRDEIWLEGEVVCAPHLSLEEVAHKLNDNDAREKYNEWRETQTQHNQKFSPFHPGPEYEVLAKYSLGFKPGFLYYDEGGKPYEPYGSEGPTWYTSPSIGVLSVVDLSVGVVMRNKDRELFFNVSSLLTVDLDEFESSLSKKALIPTGSPSAKEEIEKALVKDCLNRQHYERDHTWRSVDPRILDLVLRGWKVPSGFEYLADFAQEYAKMKRQPSQDTKTKEQAATQSKKEGFR